MLHIKVLLYQHCQKQHRKERTLQVNSAFIKHRPLAFWWDHSDNLFRDDAFCFDTLQWFWIAMFNPNVNQQHRTLQLYHLPNIVSLRKLLGSAPRGGLLLLWILHQPQFVCLLLSGSQKLDIKICFLPTNRNRTFCRTHFPSWGEKQDIWDIIKSHGPATQFSD